MKQLFGRRYWILLIGGLLLCIIPGGYITWNELDPEFTCARCHEVTPSHKAWLTSAHAGVTCTECHGTALSDGYHSMAEKAGMVFTHLSADKRNEDIHLTERQVLEISDRCMQCHQSEYAGWLRGGHAVNYKEIFMDTTHNVQEKPYWDCFRCHGMFYDKEIHSLMDLEGRSSSSWKMKDKKQEMFPAVPCLACHQIHTANPASKRYVTLSDSSGVIKKNPRTALYVRADKLHVRSDKLTPVEMFHDSLEVHSAKDPNTVLCMQCHAPDYRHQAGHEDDRTPVGFHEGISCIACHRPHSGETRESCIQCHPSLTQEEINSVYADPHGYRHIRENKPSLSVKTVKAKKLSKVRVSGMFSDDMVLQRDVPISVWGTADPEERIQVSFNASSVMCCTDATGGWSASLPAQKAGGPYTLTIKAEQQTVIFRNILVGDVWFASGQSNMEHPLEGWRWVPNSNIYRSEEEIADSGYPEIRLFTVPRYPSSTPVRDVPEGKWEVAGPETVRRFSSTAWFFGKELYAKLNVPIGIIHASWAGTSIKTWASKEVIGQFKDSAGIPAVAPVLSRKEVIKAVNENKERRFLISYPKEGQVDEVNRLPLSTWQPVTIPGMKRKWQEVVWLKKEIDISEAAAKEVQELSLGFLKGQSLVYFNGTKIGYYAYPEPVVALIPRELVCPGKNTLTVRLAIPFGSPEAEGDPGLFYLSARNHAGRCELSGEWLVTTSPDTIPAAQEEYRNFTSALFNGMVNPCMPFGIKGIIWYQGEDDANRPQLYEKMFNALVQDWRKKWNIKNLPFLYVQVTDGLISPQGEEDTCRRVFQGYQKLSLPGTGMVVSRDVGDPYDVHPRNKKEIGSRLARKALEIVYK